MTLSVIVKQSKDNKDNAWASGKIKSRGIDSLDNGEKTSTSATRSSDL